MSAENRTNHPGSKRPCGKVRAACVADSNRERPFTLGRYVAHAFELKRESMGWNGNYGKGCRIAAACSLRAARITDNVQTRKLWAHYKLLQRKADNA